MVLTEFKAALKDFFKQTGQTRDSFKPYIFPVGGDGLTYKKWFSSVNTSNYTPTIWSQCVL
jgi:hypothetical protein